MDLNVFLGCRKVCVLILSGYSSDRLLSSCSPRDTWKSYHIPWSYWWLYIYWSQFYNFSFFITSIISCIFIRYFSSTDGQPLLASGDSSGVICIWNLEKQKLQSVIREAHDSSIVSLHFFANEPVLMSAATDNSIKVRNNSYSCTCVHYRHGKVPNSA